MPGDTSSVAIDTTSSKTQGESQQSKPISAPEITDQAPAPSSGAEVQSAGDPLVSRSEETGASAQDDRAPDPPSVAQFDPATAGGRAPPKPFLSFVDEISDRQILGWVMMRKMVSRRCVVVLKEGERVLARAAASRFRRDVLAAGVGDGCYGFAIPMPQSLLDGNDHTLDLQEEETGLSLTPEPISWKSGIGSAGRLLKSVTRDTPVAFLQGTRTNSRQVSRSAVRTQPKIAFRMLFDISDLVYYIGHHPNLTGIQRVQSSIVLSLVRAELIAPEALTFISFNTKNQKWITIPTGFLISLLEDLFSSPDQRIVAFPPVDARLGILPGAVEFDGTGVLDVGTPSVFCLLGAAWVQRDYFHKLIYFKRRFGTKFVMTIHDLIPIYARETCDQGTALVFEEFLRRAIRHVDHWLSVSEHTAKDLRRYVRSLGLPEPSITVTRNGSSFQEFLPVDAATSDTLLSIKPKRFVLFVATVEGRKNHRLILEIWRRMLRDGEDPPHLICVGRIGWRSQSFISELVETNYLNGKVILLQDISDAQLSELYRDCMFTLYPSLYEGWGLPVGESLAAGKICVCSSRSSLPEVAGEHCAYIDIDDPEAAWQVIRNLIQDAPGRRRREKQIRASYNPITWSAVAQMIVGACRSVVRAEWVDPYPYAAIPYLTELNFASIGNDADNVLGEDMLRLVEGSRKPHFQSQPLPRENFLLAEEARAFGAWAEPESWGTWLCDPGGELILALGPHPSREYHVFLRLRASGPATGVPVALSLNGIVQWQQVIGPTARNLVLSATKTCSDRGGAWQLRISASINLPPEKRAEIAAADSRVPVIGFERLLVVPADDVKARLDVLYKILI